MLLTGIIQGNFFMSGILQGYGKTIVLDRGVTSFKWNSPIFKKLPCYHIALYIFSINFHVLESARLRLTVLLHEIIV
jgi:hypothetical protein